MNEKKIRSLKFDNLNGDTPLARLAALLRRRNIRNLAILVVSIIAFCAEILIMFYIGRQYGEAADDFLIVLVPLSVMSLIYLPVLFWLIILVFKPDKTYVMRRLKRLGDPERLAGELEEDLAAEGGVLFQKGSLCVTKRFIIEANLFSYRVYPLEGLREFDCQRTLFLPAFRYENGTIIKMVSRVPLRMLRPYIGSEVKINIGIEKPEDAVSIETEKAKSRKRDIVGFVVFVLVSGALFNLSMSAWGVRAVALCCCGLLMLVLIAVITSNMFNANETGYKKTDTFIGFAMVFCPAAILFYIVYFNKLPELATFGAALYGFGMLAWLFRLSVRGATKDNRLKQTLMEIKDPGERIHKMEELCAAGFYKNRVLYLNELSALYYDKQDAEKALELVREACRAQSGKREYRVSLGVNVSEMLKLNEITYLIALRQFDEAETLLAPFDDEEYKSSAALYIINASKAQLAINKGDTKAAREYLRRMFGLSYKELPEERRVNISCHLLLLEAECDFIEKDTASALSKLDDILARSTWPASIKQAKELKKTARTGKKAGRPAKRAAFAEGKCTERRKSTGAGSRKHGLSACQAGRSSSPRCAAAERQTHSRFGTRRKQKRKGADLNE